MVVPVSEVMLSFLLFCCLMLALIDYYKEKNGEDIDHLFYELHPTLIQTWSSYVCCYRVVFSYLFSIVTYFIYFMFFFKPV